MFINTLDSSNKISEDNMEFDESVINLEAFQGDTALIQTVNKLNQLKDSEEIVA